MLMRTPKTTTHPGRFQSRPVPTLGARRSQAQLAADWIRDMMVAPPTAVAARRFGTTPYLVKRELGTKPTIDAQLAVMSATERNQFIDRNFSEDELWTHLSRITDRNITVLAT